MRSKVGQVILAEAAKSGRAENKQVRVQIDKQNEGCN